MTEALQSSNWYRVAELKPRLRGHVRIHRHAYRGQVWYVVEDRMAGKYHRFNPASHRVIGLLDGRRTMERVWRQLSGTLDEDTPTQDEVVNLLGQLFAADLIQCDVSPDVAELFQRRRKEERRQFNSRYLNPMSLRFPLIDPDAFLAWLNRWPHPYQGRAGTVIWLAMVIPALVLAPMHWPDLTENFSEQLLAMDNLLVMAVIFPLLKAFHELGHGLATKARGGEVHDMGIMLMVLFPIPYVEASSASAFVKKADRIIVGAAGMLTELLLAAFAFYFWLILEPGLARSLAYNVIVLASVSTVLFNANPLLRYDGYYILADWLEIPNLTTRANQYWRYLLEYHAFDLTQTEPPAATTGEKRWFLFFTPTAFIYRMSVTIGIALFIAQQYFFVGVLLALWSLVAGIGIPLFKGLRALVTEPKYALRGSRIRLMLGGAFVLSYLLFFVLPLPYHSTVDGVLWLPEQALLRAESSGFVQRVSARPGTSLDPGMPVLESHDPELGAKLEAQLAKLAEIQVRYDAAWGSNPAQAAQLEEQVQREQAVVDRLREQYAQLTLRSAAHGTLLLDRPDDLPGRHLKRGEIVGYVVGEHVPLVRVVVRQEDVDQVRAANRDVEIKLADDLAVTWIARVMREVPAAGKELPSPALGQRGGGEVILDPSDKEGLKSVQSLFEFELELPKDAPGHYLGSRVLARFEHAATPIGIRGWHQVRRLFLSQFHV